MPRVSGELTELEAKQVTIGSRRYIVSRTHSLRSRVLSRQDQGRIVQDSVAACDLETRSQIIWAKNNFAIGAGTDAVGEENAGARA